MLPVLSSCAGSEYGVARAARLIAVRVLDCGGSGAWSWIIAGIDWVRANHIKPAVANMSLGGPSMSSVNTAVNNAVNAGVTFVVAAGNSNADVAGVAAIHLGANPNASPSAVESAIRGGATPSKVTNPRAGSPNMLLYSRITVATPPGAFTVSAVGYKVRGAHHADVTWSGASGNVNVFRGTTIVGANRPSQGTLTDNIGTKGGGISYTYQACLVSASTTCSNSVTITY